MKETWGSSRTQSIIGGLKLQNGGGKGSRVPSGPVHVHQVPD